MSKQVTQCLMVLAKGLFCSVFRRSITRHRNFLSFDNPPGDRKASITIERPTISLEIPRETQEPASIVVDVPCTRKCTAAKMSRSFEQPTISEKPKTQRMCASLDVTTIRMDSISSSIAEEDKSSSVSINLDEMRITAPLLESLKSSDV